MIILIISSIIIIIFIVVVSSSTLLSRIVISENNTMLDLQAKKFVISIQGKNGSLYLSVNDKLKVVLDSKNDNNPQWKFVPQKQSDIVLIQHILTQKYLGYIPSFSFFYTVQLTDKV